MPCAMRAAMAKLFRDEPDAKQIMKMRSVYEMLETPATAGMGLDREESLGATGALGVGVGIAGVALILGLDVGAESAGLVGAAMVLGASLCYALSGFLLKRRLSGLPAIGLSASPTSASFRPIFRCHVSAGRRIRASTTSARCGPTSYT